MDNMPDQERKYITQDEFERFESINTRSFDELRTAISDIAREVRVLANRPTNWGWVLTGIGVFATIIAMIGGLVAYGLNSRMDTNAGQIEKVSARMDSRLMAFDESLQREMRLLDDALQREMRLIDEPILVRLNSIEAQAQANANDLAVRSGKRFNREDFDKYVLPKMNELDGLKAELSSKSEKIRALEEMMDETRGNRFTRHDFNEYVLPQLMDLTNRITDAERVIADRSSTIESVRREQERRRPLVYDDEKRN